MSLPKPKVPALESGDPCLLYSTTGAFLGYSSSPYHKMRVWDARTGDKLTDLKLLNRCKPHAFDVGPGRLFLVMDSRSLSRWDTQTGNQIETSPEDLYCCVAVSPGGSTVARGRTDGTIEVSQEEQPQVTSSWATTPKGLKQILTPRHRKKSTILAGHGERVNAIAFSPGGGSLVSGSKDHTVKL